VIHEDKEFSHDGGEGDLGGFAGQAKPLIGGLGRAIAEGGHVEGPAHRGPAAAGISGLTKSQIVNDALKVHFGIQDPMLATRLDVVRAALRNSGPQKGIRYPDLPPSGASANEPTPPARKTTPRRSK
jgi:hypothetical protein